MNEDYEPEYNHDHDYFYEEPYDWDHENHYDKPEPDDVWELENDLHMQTEGPVPVYISLINNGKTFTRLHLQDRNSGTKPINVFATLTPAEARELRDALDAFAPGPGNQG